MGIPGLFQWIVTRFPSSVYTKIPGCPSSSRTRNSRSAWKYSRRTRGTCVHAPPATWDVVAIDANALIHNACRSVLQRFQHANVDALETEMIQQIQHDVSFLLTERLVPQRMVYIALDGVAPCGKMNQQRIRRYRSQAERMMKQSSPSSFHETRESAALWDTNQISPGTPFLSRVSDALAHTVQQWQQEHTSCTVVVSHERIPGEGEHKLMNWLRSFTCTNRTKPIESLVLLGADADLVFLGLLNAHPVVTHTWICRDEQCEEWIHLPTLYDEWSRTASEPTQSSSVSALVPRMNPRRWLLDTTLLVALGGNDFLPGLMQVQIREGDLDRLFQVYAQHVPHFGYLVAEESPTWPLALARFGLARLLRTFSSVSRDPSVYKGTQDTSSSSAYYVRYFGLGVSSRHVCMQYIHTLLWVLSYYTQNTSMQTHPRGWQWTYPWHFPPLLEDVVRVLEEEEEEEEEDFKNPHDFKNHPHVWWMCPWECMEPPIVRQTCSSVSFCILPWQQLLCILPPQSAVRALPKSWSRLLTSSSSLSLFTPQDPTQVPIEFAPHTTDPIALVPFVPFSLVYGLTKPLLEVGEESRLHPLNTLHSQPWTFGNLA